MDLDRGRELVRELAERLARGGVEAELAATALGLLFERDRAERWLAVVGPALDEVIRRVFSPDLRTAPQLSPLAVHEAILAVRELIDTAIVPDPSLVRVLLGALEPANTPELAGRLGTALEAARDAVPDLRAARRAVRDLASAAYDARALALVRLAEARGHRARATGQLVLMLRHHPFANIALDGDADRLQRRPGHRELISNDGGRALLRIDPFKATTNRLPLTADVPIRWWCFRRDGAHVLALPASGTATLVPLDGGAPRAIRVPAAFERAVDVRYLWDERRGIIAAGWVSWSFFAIGDELAEHRSVLVRRDEPAWVASLASASEARALRTEPAESRVIVFDATTAPAQLAAVDWSDESRSVRVPAHVFVPDAACDGARLYVLYEHEVHALDAGGALVDIYAAPEGMRLRALETLPAGDGQPPVLAVIAAALDGDPAIQLLLYELPNAERVVRPTLESGREVVHRLVLAMAGDGADAKDAAVELALLVERDVANMNAHSRAEHDDYLAKVYGADVAAQRLSPLAIHEARCALRARVRRGVSDVAFIYALNKARAATVPDLLAVLEDALEAPALEPIAHEAVNGIALEGHDPRAVAMLRRASERGHGEARQTAQRWLVDHTDPRTEREAPAYAIARRSLGVNVWQLRRRPDRDELIAAADGALLRIDPSSAHPPERIPLPFKEVLAWCLRDDGERALALSRGRACVVSLDDGSVRELRAPAPHHLWHRNPFEDLRHCWAADRALFAAGSVRGYWRLVDEGEPHFERVAAQDVRREVPAWWDELEMLSPWSSRVLRAEPWRTIAFDRGELLVFERHDRRSLRVEVPQFYDEVAFDGRLFLLEDFQVGATDAAGDHVATFAAPDGMVLHSLEVIAPHLAVVATPRGGRPSELLLYELPR